MKFERFKLNKNIFKQIIIRSGINAVAVSVFCALMDFILKHEFSLHDKAISCLQLFVVLIVLYIVAPWMRKGVGIDTEDKENT